MRALIPTPALTLSNFHQHLLLTRKGMPMEKQASKLLAQRLAYHPALSLVALQVVTEVEKELGRQASIGDIREVLKNRTKLLKLARESRNLELLAALSESSGKLQQLLCNCAELLD